MFLAMLGAIFIGLCLGLLGSGGSILTLPILVYVLHRPDKIAMTESLAIVGAIALAGTLPYVKRGQIHWKTVIYFGFSGVLGAYLGACLSTYFSGSLQLALFGVAMLLAAWMMINDVKWMASSQPVAQSWWLLMLEGFFLGNMTGCIGIGGGFLIVPTLVLLVSLPMHLAIGTSLLIITLNASTAFLQHYITLLNTENELNWPVVSLFILMGIVGSLIGSTLSKKIPQAYLKKAFGWMMLPLGFYILAKQLLV